MSEENVEVVRRWLAIGRLDPEAIRAYVAEFCDADVDYYPVRKFSEARPCHGLEEFSEFLAGWGEAWSRLEWAVRDLIEVGDDRVLAWASLRAEGRGSGVKLEGDLYQCEWLRHGRLFRIEDHLTLSGALHALGLEGETLHAAGLSEEAMASENVEIVRAHIEAVRSHDFPRALSSFDSHVVVDMSRVAGVEDAAVGPEGVADYMRRYAGTFEDYRYEAERLTDLGSGAVLAVVTETGRGKGSGVPVNRSFATLYTVIDGEIVRATLFRSEEDALKAAGLSE